MKAIFENDVYRIEQVNDKYIVSDKTNYGFFVSYFNGAYDLIKLFTKSDLKIEFGIEF